MGTQAPREADAVSRLHDMLTGKSAAGPETPPCIPRCEARIRLRDDFDRSPGKSQNWRLSLAFKVVLL